MILASNIAEAHLNALRQLVTVGPVHESELDAIALSELIQHDLAVNIVHIGSLNYIAATIAGANLYCRCFNSTSIQQAQCADQPQVHERATPL